MTAPWCLGYVTQVMHCLSHKRAALPAPNGMQTCTLVHIITHSFLRIPGSAAALPRHCNSPPPLNTDGKFTLDDLPQASRNIAQAEMRGELKDAKRLEQLVAHWAGAPPKEDTFKYARRAFKRYLCSS